MGESDIIQKAIEAEEYNRDFYQALTSQAIAKYAGSALKQLADEEQRHVDLLTKYRESFKSRDSVEIPDGSGFADIWKKHNAAIDETRAALQPHTDELTVVQRGIELEQNGIRLYGEAKENATDAAGKEVFGFLHAQEQIHKTYLEKLQKKLMAIYQEPPESRPRL